MHNLSTSELLLAAFVLICAAGAGWFAGGAHFEPHFTERMARYGDR